MGLLEDITKNVVLGRADRNATPAGELAGQPGVRELTQQAIDEGVPLSEILETGLLSGMAVVGERMKCNEIFIPEVLQSARAVKEGLALLKPLLAASGAASKGKMVIGTVQGDVHDIGKTLVGMVVEGAGFDVIDLGNDIPTEKWIGAVQAEHPAVLGMSAMLTTTMVRMRQVVEALEGAELRDKVKVIVGGAPITESYAKDIGADGFASDAAAAVDKVKELLSI